MLIYKTIIIADTERALLFKDQRFIKVLTPGKHRILQAGCQIEVQRYDITAIGGIKIDEKLHYLMQLYPNQFKSHVTVYETGIEEIALVYRHGLLQHIITESSRVGYWQANTDLQVEKLDISQSQPLPVAVDQAITQTEGINLRKFSAKTLILQVADNKRALLYYGDRFLSILEPGQYRYWDAKQQLKVNMVNIVDPLSISADSHLLQLIDQYPNEFAKHIQTWETNADEVGLVYENNVLRDIVSPAKRGVFWRTQRKVEVKKCLFTEDFQLDNRLARQLNNSPQLLLQEAAKRAICSSEIPDNHVGFLLLDGKLSQTLNAGYYAWWRFNRKLEIKILDCRLQTMEVNGQEILTKDRVSLRINLSATWQIQAAEKIIQQLKDHKVYLYSELQLALRTIVSTKTLDELLADKNLLNQEVKKIVASKLTPYGIELHSVGVKDIILPGEMKEILAQVVEAQKIAEANLIRRREETQATRSLHNTAKVMDGNPTLLRLKELETLERITAQISTLNVYGGLNSVMNDIVKLTDNTQH